MIVIKFTDADAKRRALGYLAGRFSFKSWANGEMVVPEAALSALALEGIRFVVEGPATYERTFEALFGAVSSETQTIRGFWHHQGEQHRDTLMRVFVDVADLPENREFFAPFKERMKARFRQVDIWLTTYPIEAL